MILCALSRGYGLLRGESFLIVLFMFLFCSRIVSVVYSTCESSQVHTSFNTSTFWSPWFLVCVGRDGNVSIAVQTNVIQLTVTPSKQTFFHPRIADIFLRTWAQYLAGELLELKTSIFKPIRRTDTLQNQVKCDLTCWEMMKFYVAFGTNISMDVPVRINSLFICRKLFYQSFFHGRRKVWYATSRRIPLRWKYGSQFSWQQTCAGD